MSPARPTRQTPAVRSRGDRLTSVAAEAAFFAVLGLVPALRTVASTVGFRQRSPVVDPFVSSPLPRKVASSEITTFPARPSDSTTSSGEVWCAISS